MTAACPFCAIDPVRVFHRGEWVIGVWDAFPVPPGHALLVPERHIATWFDATAAEQSELTRAIDIARRAILERHQPDGFNIGIDIGESAGQTVFHLHVHVIPRYRGDVPDPRGGVRHVIPQRANYLQHSTDTASAVIRDAAAAYRGVLDQHAGAPQSASSRVGPRTR